jgi:hypothetical protein
MPIGSGSVSATGINLELGKASNSTLSINTAEDGGYGAINQCSPSRPSSTDPASYSEWRNYNHGFACCNTPAITSVSNPTSSSLDVYWVGLSNCSASHIEYSTNQSTWSTTSSGCTSPRTISGLASSTTYYFRIRITCTSTGGYSAYSNTMSGTTSGSFPAYGTYLSQYCSGCTLYYRYANGSGGTYDVSQGCSTACGGCCCAPGAGTYLNSGCQGCAYYDYYADGCYGSYSQLLDPDSPNCGCGGGGGGSCYVAMCSTPGPAYGTDCSGQVFSYRCNYAGEWTGICWNISLDSQNLDYNPIDSCSGSFVEDPMRDL